MDKIARKLVNCSSKATLNGHMVCHKHPKPEVPPSTPEATDAKDESTVEDEIMPVFDNISHSHIIISHFVKE